MGCECSSDSSLPIGPAGTNGANGANGDFITITGAPGFACPSGGYAINLFSGVNPFPLISQSIVCNGNNGNNGTNAFKFVKEFYTEGYNQVLSVPYASIVQCIPIPAGCPDSIALPQTASHQRIDYHLQVWLLIPLAPPSNAYWVLLTQNGLTLTADYSVAVNNVTGNMLITTGNNVGTYRVVILA